MKFDNKFDTGPEYINGSADCPPGCAYYIEKEKCQCPGFLEKVIFDIEFDIYKKGIIKFLMYKPFNISFNILKICIKNPIKFLLVLSALYTIANYNYSNLSSENKKRIDIVNHKISFIIDKLKNKLIDILGTQKQVEKLNSHLETSSNEIDDFGDLDPIFYIDENGDIKEYKNKVKHKNLIKHKNKVKHKKQIYLEDATKGLF